MSMGWLIIEQEKRSQRAVFQVFLYRIYGSKRNNGYIEEMFTFVSYY
jgi:hypothetical protein